MGGHSFRVFRAGQGSAKPTPAGQIQLAGLFTGAWPYAVPFAWPVVASRCDSLSHCARSCQPQCLQYLLSGPVEERFADPSWGAVILSPGHMSGPRDVRRSPHLCLPRPKVLTQSFRRGPGHWPCSRLPTRGPRKPVLRASVRLGICVCVFYSWRFSFALGPTHTHSGQ